MSVNKYDLAGGQRYVSTYVPLPLDQIGQMAKQYSADYKAGKQAPHALDQLDQAIKAAPVDVDNKKALMDDYHSKMNDIVSTARPEDYAKPEYQQKIGTLINQFKNDPRLNSIMNNKEVFDKVYTPYLNSKDAKKDLVLTNILDEKHPTKYSQLKPGESLKPLDYVPHEYAIKGAKTIMDDVKIDGKSLSSIGAWNKDNNYFLDTDGHQKQITSNKIMELAKQNVGNYAENTEGRFRFKTLLHDIKGDPHMSYSEFKSDKSIPQEAKDYVEQELTKDLYSYGVKQIFKDVDMSYGLKDNVMNQYAGKKAIDEQPNPGLPQTAPDTQNIEDITKEIPENIKDFVSYNKQPDGTYAVKINLDNLGKDLPIYGPNAILMGTKPGDVKGDTKRILDYVYNAAKSIGYGADPKKGISWDPKKATIANAKEILTQYLDYSKNISPQEILDGPIQDVISHNIINDRENYTIKDSSGKTVINEDQEAMKTFKVNSRTYKDGNQIIKGGYFDTDGAYKTVTVVPHSNQSNNYFNIVGGIKQSVHNFFKTGEISKEDKETISSFEDAYAPRDANNKPIPMFSAPGYKGLEPISIKKVPGQVFNDGSPKQFIITMSDKNNRKDVKTYLVDIETGTKSELPGGLNGAIQYVSTSWYTKTPEGNKEALQLTNAKGKYEGTTQGQ